MQEEADKLKDIADAGVRTKLVALGITSAINEAELNDVASAPQDVILVEGFNRLAEVEDQLRKKASCSGQ